MRLIVRFALLISLFSLSKELVAQSPRVIIDSLLLRIQEELPNAERAGIYSELGWQYASVNLDSAIYFGQLAVKSAEQTGDKKLLSQAHSDLGSGYIQKGELEPALTNYKTTLRLREEIADSAGIAKVYNNLGYIYQRIYESDSALMYFLRGLTYFEKTGDLANVASVKNNVAVIYRSMTNYDKAIQLFEEVAEYRSGTQDFRGLSGTYANLGSIYKSLKEYTKAREYFEQSISSAEEGQDLFALATAYRNYTLFLNEVGETDQAIAAAEKGLLISKEVNAQYETAALEFNLGIAYQEKGQFERAKPYYLSAEKAFVAQGSAEDVVPIYLELIPLYAAIGKHDSSRYYSNLYQETLRSRIEKESREVMAELETKYQTEKKDLEIAQQQLEIRSKNLQLYGSLALAIILGIVGYLLYKQQKLKNHQLQQEGELKLALGQIETQNKLQEQRMLISRDLHDNIGAQLTFIISAIENLKYFDPIKETLTHRYDSIANFTKQTITELRDTIWAMNSGQITLGQLSTRISDYLQQAGISTQGITYDFEVDKNLDPSFHLVSSEGIQIYRIVQEAIQNALKYAYPSQIHVSVSQSEGYLRLAVKDDGTGFDESQIKPGNGLYNMRKRAEELGGKLEIQSQPAKGTTVILLVPQSS